MSAYSPPVENVPIFDAGLFRTTNGDGEFLTIAEANRLYLQFPFGQGSETIPAVNITGNATISQNIVMNGTPAVNYLEFPDGTRQFTSGTETLQQVLTNGNTATGLSALFIDGVNRTTTISNSQVKVEENDTINYGLNSATISASSSGVSSIASLSLSSVSVPDPIYGSGSGSALLTSSLGNPYLGLATSAPFTNSTSLTIDLNNITHSQSTGSPSPNNDFTITTDKNLVLVGNNISATTSNLSITSAGVGGSANPILTLTNTNATAGNTNGVPLVEYYKSGRNVVANDIVASQRFNANNYLGTKTPFGRIDCVATSSSAGAGDDGSLDFYSCVNGTSSLVFRMNGADNENNSFRPLDMTGNNIKTSSGNMTIETTASTGNGNITINTNGTNAVGDINMTAKGNVDIISNGAGGFIDLTAVSSIALTATGDNLVLRGGTLAQLEATGAGGDIIIKPETGAGDLVFEGANIESASRGSNSGQNLRIKLNGVYYKIQLYDDT